MSIQKIEGAIWAKKYSWERQYHFYHSAITDPENRHMLKDGRIYIAPYTIEIEIDGNLEEMLHKKAIKALQKERRLILAENQKRIDEVDRRISELTAIEHKPEVEVAA